MKKENYLSISAFSKISDISRKALIFYDKIGLFSPAYIDKQNGYRYYSHKQIGQITLIHTLTELGVPLKEIKNCIQTTSLPNTIALFERQNLLIKQKIEHLKNTQNMIQMRLSQMKKGRALCQRQDNSSTLNLVEIKQTIPIHCGSPISCSKKSVPDKIMVDFYNRCESQGLPFGYTVGYIVEKENILKKNYDTASHICFRLKNKKYANMFLPAGSYLVAYGKGDYGSSEAVYPIILDFLAEKGYRIAGNALEEYLLDEITTQKSENYLFQISIPVISS